MTKVRLGCQGKEEQHDKSSTGEARAKRRVRKAKVGTQAVFALDVLHGSLMSIMIQSND